MGSNSDSFKLEKSMNNPLIGLVEKIDPDVLDSSGIEMNPHISNPDAIQKDKRDEVKAHQEDIMMDLEEVITDDDAEEEGPQVYHESSVGETKAVKFDHGFGFFVA